MIHIIPGLLVSSILQCKLYCHEGKCLELLQAIGHFEPIFIEAQQPSMMVCKVRSLKLRIKICSFLEEIITSTNEVFKDVESDMVVGIRKPCNATEETAESKDTVKKTAGS